MRSKVSDSQHVCLSCLLQLSKQRVSAAPSVRSNPRANQDQSSISSHASSSSGRESAPRYGRNIITKTRVVRQPNLDPDVLPRSSFQDSTYDDRLSRSSQIRKFHASARIFGQLEENRKPAASSSNQVDDLQILRDVQKRLQKGVARLSEGQPATPAGLTLEAALKAAPDAREGERQRRSEQAAQGTSEGGQITKVDYDASSAGQHKKSNLKQVSNAVVEKSRKHLKPGSPLNAHSGQRVDGTALPAIPSSNTTVKSSKGARNAPHNQSQTSSPDQFSGPPSLKVPSEFQINHVPFPGGPRQNTPPKGLGRIQVHSTGRRRPAFLRSRQPLVVRGVRSDRRGDTSSNDKADTDSEDQRMIPAIDGFDVTSISADDLQLNAIATSSPKVPSLSFDLSRVLFNPGVYQLQDPRSRVYNFDPYLAQLMPVTEFNFDALNKYVTSSEDNHLRNLGMTHNKKYVGSSSSMSAVLCHFHFLLSSFRSINLSQLSRAFKEESGRFTRIQHAPAAMYLRWKDGVYGVDADKEYDSGNILMSLGKSMEKLMTLEKEEFERYRKNSSTSADEVERETAPEAYHYSEQDDFLLRAQLDAHDPRLPGTGMFDLKTRAVAAIRMNIRNHERGMGYQIRDRFGTWESYEREYYDMIRSAFLKYSIQVRMGRMDGIFVAYHNVERIFGFQYIPRPELDLTLHGQTDGVLGDAEFRFSIKLLNEVFDRATAKFPKQSLQFHFETREGGRGEPFQFMYVFAQPVTEELVQRRQNLKRKEMDEFERRIFNPEVPEVVVQTGGESSDHAASSSAAQETESVQHKIAMPALPRSGPDEQATSSDSVRQSAACEAPLPAAVEASQQDFMSKTTAPVEKSAGSIETSISDDAHPETASETIQRTDGSTQWQPLQPQSNAANVALLNDLCKIKINEKPSSVDTTGTSPTSTKPPYEDEQIVGFKVYIRNKVNDVPVVRPINLTPSQRWTVDYSIVDMKEDQVKPTYNMCKQRRRTVLAERQDSDVAANFYLKRLARITEEGAAWRREQDEIDRERDPVMLYGKKDVSDGQMEV